jgi:hypothetical protein
VYCSLDRSDIELEPRNGRSRVVQTDHRTVTEMMVRPTLSQIIVLIRCLNPRRVHRELDLFYNFAHEPPPSIRRALDAGAGHLWVGDDASFLDADIARRDPDPASIDAFANAAFDELADGLISEPTNCDPFRCLTSMEGRLVGAGFPEQSDEESLWPTVLELGALSARAIRLTNGGSWTFDPGAKGTLPLSYICTFNGEPATVNPLGKALKFICAKGGGEEPSALVRMLAAST